MNYVSAGGVVAETIPIADLLDVSGVTGSGQTVVLQTSPTITTPIIASLSGSASAAGSITINATTHATPGAIIFKLASGTEAGRFLATGELLLGYTASVGSERLGVTANVARVRAISNSATGDALYTVQNSSGALLHLAANGSGASAFANIAAGEVGIVAESAALSIGTSGALAMRLATNGATRMVIDSTGLVRINGAPATGILTVTASSLGSAIGFPSLAIAILGKSGDSGADQLGALEFGIDSGSSRQGVVAGYWETSNNGGLQFRTSNDGGNSTSRALVLNRLKHALFNSTSDNGFHYIVQDVTASATAVPAFRLDGGAHTGLTLSTEYTDVYFNLARTVQFAGGALATNRAFRVGNPTYAFTGASTLTKAVTFSISGAPVAGTDATITQSWAMEVEAGRALFSGGITVAAEGTGLAGAVSYTNTVDTSANSTGTGTIKFKGATSRDSSGFLKILDGTTARYVPFFDAITG